MGDRRLRGEPRWNRPRLHPRGKRGTRQDYSSEDHDHDFREFKYKHEGSGEDELNERSDPDLCAARARTKFSPAHRTHRGRAVGEIETAIHAFLNGRHSRDYSTRG